MKKSLRLAAAALLACAAIPANAQFYQLANQVTDMISNSVLAGARYRGFATLSYGPGLGNKRADMIEVTTTQGMQCSNLFFIGLGLGVDVLLTDVPDNIQYPPNQDINGHGFTKTGIAIPLYSDFRFTFGDKSKIGAFIDARLGAAFFAGNDYIQVGDGYITNSQCFYFKPTVGMRIPINSANNKVALNVGVSYQLMTSSYWYVSNNNMTLNSIGISVGMEW